MQRQKVLDIKIKTDKNSSDYLPDPGSAQICNSSLVYSASLQVIRVEKADYENAYLFPLALL